MSEIRSNPTADIHPIIARRWSPRSFAGERPVETDKLRSCIEAARWAPSCYGDEPWRFIICDKSAHPEAWQRLLSCLAPKNREWAVNAPVLMLVSAATRFRNGKPNRWGEYDTGQAAMSLCLQATALGLATHQMGGFDVTAVREAFGIPEEYTPMAALALGYPAEADRLPEAFRTMETAPRRRQPVETCFGVGVWPGDSGPSAED